MRRYMWAVIATVSTAVFLLIALLSSTALAASNPVTVNVELQAHNNSILSIPANGSASYYDNGWHAITALNPNNPAMVQVDLAPGTYAFALTYNGTRDQKTVVITGDQANQTVYFHTMLVNVELQAHDNSALDIPGNGSASYYAGGWHAITTLNVNNPAMVTTEMLPGTYNCGDLQRDA